MNDGTRFDRLESQVSKLAAKDDIYELKYNYAYTADARDWDRFLALFTDDAAIAYPDSDEDESYHGRDGLQRFVEQIDEKTTFTSHMLHNPVVSVQGETADGKWYFEVPAISRDGSAVWIQGRYEDEYRNDDGEWKIARMEIHYNYRAGYHDGWEGAVK